MNILNLIEKHKDFPFLNANYNISDYVLINLYWLKYIQNYINQSEKLSLQAKKQIETYNFENIIQSIWVTLNFLLIFLNIALFWRKK